MPELFHPLAGQAVVAIDHAALALAYDTTPEGWAQALDLRDKETEGHSQRVMQLTLDLARAAGVGDAELAHIRRGTLLHDIGKMGIPDSILLKPGPLDDAEWEIMRKHPTALAQRGRRRSTGGPRAAMIAWHLEAGQDVSAQPFRCFERRAQRARPNGAQQERSKLRMDDLIKLITERTGLPADQARAAAQTTIDFIKSKLPDSMAGYVDTALNSGMIDDIAGQAGNMLGGLFGNKE